MSLVAVQKSHFPSGYRIKMYDNHICGLYSVAYPLSHIHALILEYFVYNMLKVIMQRTGQPPLLNLCT